MLRSSRFLAVGLVASLVFGQSSPAFAQSGTDKAAAEALFQQAQKLLKTKNYAEACSKLEASQQLDPAVGTLLYLGDCYEKAGRTASAWATFNEAASLAQSSGQAPRAKIASVRATALEPKLLKLTVVVPPAVATLPGFVLERDGQPVPKASFGTPIPVDPGEHTLSARADGKKPWTGQAKIESTSVELTVPELADAEKPPPAVTSPPPAASAPPKQDTARPPPPPPPSSSLRPTLGWVAVGVGAVGVGLGAFFGLQAQSKNDDSLALCRPDDPTRCTAEGKSLRDDAAGAATVSTIGFIAGGALLAGGVVLLLTSPGAEEPVAVARPRRTAPQYSLRVTPGGLSFGGSF